MTETVEKKPEELDSGNGQNRLTVDSVEQLDRAIALVNDHLDHAVEVRISVT